jgi:hypothetical protein
MPACRRLRYASPGRGRPGFLAVLRRHSPRAFAAAAALLLATIAPPARAGTNDFDLGFIASRLEQPDGSVRRRALGPFLEIAETTNGARLVAVRPFVAEVSDPAAGRAATDMLWPLGVRRQFHEQSQSRFLIFFSFNHDTAESRSRRRLWLFPFYFSGRNAQGEEYRAFFPIGGRIDEFLGRDSIRFVLFPLHSRSTLNELETSNWIWPLISRTESPTIHRWRVFPLYGESETEGQFRKRFVLWPIWTDATYETPGAAGSGFILFPLVGRIATENQRTFWLVPPLFRITRGAKANVTYFPWPFIQRVTGEVDKRYFWPLWGRRTVDGEVRHFVLWPIFSKERHETALSDSRSFVIFPVFRSRIVREREGDGAIQEDYTKLWPLLGYRREGDSTRVRMPDLWPFREFAPVDRSWAPLWTLYASDAKGDDRESELLWGLYRRSQRDGRLARCSLFPLYGWKRGGDGPEDRSWSVLKGLLAFDRAGSHRTYRLLYFLRFERDDDPPSSRPRVAGRDFGEARETEP